MKDTLTDADEKYREDVYLEFVEASKDGKDLEGKVSAQDLQAVLYKWSPDAERQKDVSAALSEVA